MNKLSMSRLSQAAADHVRVWRACRREARRTRPSHPALSIGRRELLAGFFATGLASTAEAGWWLRVSTAAITAGIQTITPSAAWVANPQPKAGFGGQEPVQTGVAISGRPEYGYMGRLPMKMSGLASFTTDGTVAPVGQWLMPCLVDSMFSGDQLLAVQAFAANQSGIKDGVLKVIFNLEGAVVEVSAQSLVDVPLYDGTSRKVPAFAVTIPGASLPDGGMEAYATIVPSLWGAMNGIAQRVIGPMRLYRQSAPDVTINVAPSAAQNLTSNPRSYQTFQDALTYAATVRAGGAKQVRIVPLEDMTIDASTKAYSAGSSYHNDRGIITFDCRGRNVTFANTVYGEGSPQLGGVRIIKATLDIANIKSMSQNYSSIGRALELNYCTIMSSRGVKTTGKLDLYNGNIRPDITFNTNANIALTQCTVTDAPCQDIAIAMQIGCSMSDLYFDVCRSPGGMPAQYVANDNQRISGGPYRTGYQAFQLTFSGSGTGTFDIVGAGGATKQLVLKVNGAAVLTLSASVTVNQGIYTMQDAVTAINASGTGFTATPQPNATWNDIRFAQVGVASTVTPSTASANNPLSTVLVGAFDLHCDSFQMQQDYNHDNELMYGCYSFDCQTQPFFWNVGTTGNPAGAHNCALINCCLSNSGTSAATANFGVWSLYGGFHLLMAHVSLPNNQFLARLDFAYESVDALSRVHANVFDIVSSGVPSSYSSTIIGAFSGAVANNVILTTMTGALVPGVRTTGAVELGIANTIEFPALSAASLGKAGFTPRRGLGVMSNLVAPEVMWDIEGRPRAANDCAGAVALSAVA